jgi:hypothetical protein
MINRQIRQMINIDIYNPSQEISRRGQTFIKR